MAISPFRIFKSIQMKMFAVIFGLTAVLVAFLVFYFPHYHVMSMRRRLEVKTETYGRLVSRQVESAIAFDDRETAREVFTAIQTDNDVRALALYAVSGRPLLIMGELTDNRAPTASPQKASLEPTNSSIRALVPVVSKEGPRGTLVVELSTVSIDEERERIEEVAIIAGVLAMLGGVAVSWLIARSLSRRLRAIADVTRVVAGGDLTKRTVPDTSEDEIGQLARSFDGMLLKIRTLVDDISTMAATEKTRLDHLVTQRTEELARRDNDMRLLLDNVGEGFLTVDLEGGVSREKSAIVETWLGPAKPGMHFADYVEPVDSGFAENFRVGLEVLAEGVMPAEVCLEQMPALILHGGQHLRVRYSPIMVGVAISRILIVLSDVTSEVEREKVEANQRELLGLLGRWVNDRPGVLEFADEGEALVSTIRGEGADRQALMRAIHTLKGNCGLFGLSRMARECHDLETGIIDRNAMPSEHERLKVTESWREVLTVVRSLPSDSGDQTLHITRNDLSRLREAIVLGGSKPEILERLLHLHYEPTEPRLQRFAEQARALADRLGKPGLAVVVESNAVRLDPKRWAAFWTAFTHVVRNAVDHGIEDPEVRLAAGKQAGGVLTLRTQLDGADVLVCVSDDGMGIEWDKVAARASRVGVKYQTQQDLESALFADGLSTREVATHSSGRGVGLAAVRVALVDLGARIEVKTRRGGGTTFIFRVPQMQERAPMQGAGTLIN